MQRPLTDSIIIENPTLGADWTSSMSSIETPQAPASLPDGVTSRVENGQSLDDVKRAKDLACVDIVIATMLPDGSPAVLLSKRKKTDPFGGFWWMYGGSLTAYMSVTEFIAERAERECGVPVQPEVLVGVYRTSAADFPQSTLQPCYAALVSYQAIQEKMRTDPNHESVKLFTRETIDWIQEDERHWYPMRVALKVFEALSL